MVFIQISFQETPFADYKFNENIVDHGSDSQIFYT